MTAAAHGVRRARAAAEVASAVAAALAAGVLAGCATSTSHDRAEPSGESSSSSTSSGPDAALREELLRLQALDQAVRGGPVPDGLTADEVPTIDEVDSANQARIREIFDEHDWPGWSLVGRRGSTAAWTVVQHADLDLALQRRGLSLLRDAVAAHDASRGDLAYLTDRVLVADGHPQRYGTQWELAGGDRWVPRTPIRQRGRVDSRRRQAGLEPLADYLAELRAAVP